MFGGDGSNDPDQFKVAGLVRVELRARHHRHRRTNKALIDGWKKDNPSATLGSFGPPDLRRRRRSRCNAIKQACDAGKGTIKDRTRRHPATSRRSTSRTGSSAGTFRFSTKSNDPLNAKFYIFQIQSNGTYKLVG